ncbi:MAG: S26 family signal peptidase [Sphingobium sp.]|nr:S26 family signal peptidase [Sphingobium sp.]
MTRTGYALATMLTAGSFTGLFVAVTVVGPTPRFLWNASASAPIGLYRLHRSDPPVIGQLVAALPPAHLGRWMAERHYLPLGVPLLKHVAAGPGQRICRTGLAISIDGRPVVRARSHDSHGRPLPVWQGCRKLAQDQVLLLNPAVPDSLDGRYFSALPASVLLGRAAPILTRDAPNAPLIWRGIGS